MREVKSMHINCWNKKSVKWLDSPSQGSSGGILCLWGSDKNEVTDFLIGPYSITILCKTIPNSFEWMFSGVYVPCASYTDEVKLFWRELEEVRCFWIYPWVIGGDFNEIKFSHERSSGGENTTGMIKFNNFISRHQLIDLPLLGATYTWTNNQVHTIKCRIDRLLVSPSWECMYRQVIQKALARPSSDHNPIALFCEGVKHGPSSFRCEYYGLIHPNFISVVRHSWSFVVVSGSAGFIFCKKLSINLKNGAKWNLVMWIEGWRSWKLFLLTRMPRKMLTMV
ncbi:uncharacterized protein LOC113278927 [Papaver somniferum]|uniref:uncharacterized protein LOC113278927 n=1 Tax=Papaver somniferum TaxID=3469 RepID=UPI000E7031D0|nr:uncharacterized protein LOC113278927 [Papaver somniferum]